MANITVETGAAPAPQGLLARFVGMITSPQATFQSVVAHPRWLGMLVLTTLITAICTTLPMTTEAGREAALEQQVKQMESFGMKVDDAAYARMERTSSITPPARRTRARISGISPGSSSTGTCPASGRGLQA